MKCFNYAVDLLRFVTDSYVVGAAKKAVSESLDMEPLSELPYHNREHMRTLFDGVVESVLHLAFHPTTIDSTTEEQTLTYCFCKTTEEHGNFIKCENHKCVYNQWFHLECVNISPDNVPDEKWFCSQVCKEMSDATDDSSDIDSKFEYTKAVLWHGISEKVRHDAIREADGDRMLCHWRFDMLDFIRWHHPKYFVVGHRLLCYTSGGASDRISHQLKWNRTVNVRGGMGNNIEMDLQMEFFNKEYKEAVQDAGGNISESTVARHSQMVGIKKELKKSFDKQLGHRTKMRAKLNKNSAEVDIAPASGKVNRP